jgi:hypothetical protein
MMIFDIGPKIQPTANNRSQKEQVFTAREVICHGTQPEATMMRGCNWLELFRGSDHHIDERSVLFDMRVENILLFFYRTLLPAPIAKNP